MIAARLMIQGFRQQQRSPVGEVWHNLGLVDNWLGWLRIQARDYTIDEHPEAADLRQELAALESEVAAARGV